MFRMGAEAQSEAAKLFDRLWESKIKRFLIPQGKCQLTDEQSVEFLTDKIENFLRSFPFREQLNLCVDEKDNSVARFLRELGNSCYHPKLPGPLGTATQYYNQSIAHAEKGSEERAIAYANRSLLCLQTFRYHDCLENIRLARESNCPERLMEKLNRREAVAKDGLLKPNTESYEEEEDVEELKLSYNCHANVPQVVECLELRRNEEFGRHVVTNRKLKAGDVVIIEKPFATLPFEDYRYSLCAHCLGINAFTLIPCEGCTVTMYCSEECLSKAHRQYHRYECGILRDLWRICGTLENAVVGLRAVATAIGLFDHDLEAMKEHLDGLDESKVNAFTMDWRTAAPKDVYNTVHVLSTNQALRRRKDLSLQIFFATIIHQLMLERTELGTMCATSAEKRKLLFDLILRHFQISQVNTVSMDNVVLAGERFLSRNHLNANFSLISMLNHAGVPNVTLITLRDGRCAVMAINPIAAGEQLFVYYGFNPNDWPAYDRLPRDGGGDYVNDEDENFIRSIIRMETASEKVSACKSYLNAVGRRFPTYTLTRAQIGFILFVKFLYSILCRYPLR